MSDTLQAGEVRLSGAMARVIERVRAIVQQGLEDAVTAQAVAAIVAAEIRRDELLDQAHLEADPDRYRQHIVHCEPDGSFSVVALVWLPGQATPVHDHVSWCVVGVHRGEEDETRFRIEELDGSRCLRESGNSRNVCGSVAALAPPGDIHRVTNSGQEPAVSLHVYGADIGRLGSSIRRTYELPIRPSA